jgi:benzoate 4-monooxygenase
MMESITTYEVVAITTTLLTAVILVYIIYMRFLHPLSRYPGPMLASLTNSFKAYYVYNLRLHEKLLELHIHYGPVVRIGPNHLHFWEGEAIAPIYKGGRNMGKTDFYNAFTAFNPNLFGGTNEDVSVVRLI